MRIYYISGLLYKRIMNIRFVRRVLLLEQKERIITNRHGAIEATAYVIRWMNGSGIGLFGMFRYVVFHMKYAKQRGWIPIVDWENYDNPYLTYNTIGKENAWEYYFSKPEGYGMDDVPLFKKIVLSSALSIENNQPYFSDENMEVVGKYIKFSEIVAKRIETEKQIIKQKYGENCKILGVKIRGTDYISTRAYKHAVQPTAECAIEIIKEYQEKWGGFDACFLATEDLSIVEKMVNAFGDWIYILDDSHRLQPEEKWYNNNKLNENPKKSGEDYCVEIGLLSECNSLIASGSQGTTAALLLNQNKYENCHIIDLGVYE